MMGLGTETWCRHCGDSGEMTDEHVPPKSTENQQPVGSIDDPFGTYSIVREVAEWDEGHVVKSLDLECNGRASRWGYVREYRGWYDLFRSAAIEKAKITKVDPLRGDQPFELDLPYNVHPARFVRQVVGMFLAVQQTRDLIDGYLSLGQLIGPESSSLHDRRKEGVDIAPLSISMSVCNGRWSYTKRPMSTVEMKIRKISETNETDAQYQSNMTETSVLSLAPFAFVLSTGKFQGLGYEITEWTKWPVDRRPSKSSRMLRIPTADRLPGGLTALIYPNGLL